VPESDANSRGLRQGEGILVQRASGGGPADKAGINADDVVTNIGGKRVSDPSDVAAAIEGRSPGDQVEVEVVRPDGTRETVVVTLGRRPTKSP
jgi:S1-C subfamily serine protease